LAWGPGTPLTGWESTAEGVLTTRDGVTLPLAWPYEAGYPAAAGFESSALTEADFTSGWSGSFGGFGAGGVSGYYSGTPRANMFGANPGVMADVTWRPTLQQSNWLVPEGGSGLALSLSVIVGNMFPENAL